MQGDHQRGLRMGPRNDLYRLGHASQGSSPRLPAVSSDDDDRRVRAASAVEGSESRIKELVLASQRQAQGINDGVAGEMDDVWLDALGDQPVRGRAGGGEMQVGQERGHLAVERLGKGRLEVTERSPASTWATGSRS